MDSRLIVDLRWLGMVEARYENCVTFSEDPTNTDLFGMPQPIFHYSLASDDTERLRLMVEDMSKCAGALGKYLPGREPKVLPPGIAHHITVCTTCTYSIPYYINYVCVCIIHSIYMCVWSVYKPTIYMYLLLYTVVRRRISVGKGRE